MITLCDACNRPVGAHLPSELAECAEFDPWSCAGCGHPLPDAPAMRQGSMCHPCAEMCDMNDHDGHCTFFDPHPPGAVRRYVPETRGYEWVVPAPSGEGEKTE